MQLVSGLSLTGLKVQIMIEVMELFMKCGQRREVCGLCYGLQRMLSVPDVNFN